jgi:hypothetical protein
MENKLHILITPAYVMNEDALLKPIVLKLGHHETMYRYRLINSQVIIHIWTIFPWANIYIRYNTLHSAELDGIFPLW